MMKIFQIGFNKCGTTSIHNLFKKHCSKKYSCIHWDSGNLAITIKNNVINKDQNILGRYEKFDVITDMEYVSGENIVLAYQDYFSDLDKCYPESIFILNIRPIENWIRSRLEHETNNVSYALRYQKYFRLKNLDEVVLNWIENYYRHINNVTKYFENKNESLIIFDIEKDSFDKFKTFFANKNIYFDINCLPKSNTTKK